VGPPIIIISPFGSTSLLGSLSSVGVVTSPVTILPRPLILTPFAPTPVGGNGQLQFDEQALQTELKSLAAKSGVTIADLQSLTLDSQAISQAGFHFDGQSLKKAISDLATAVAGGTSTSQAQTEFTGLFSGSHVPSTTTIDTTFTDLTKAIQDSKVLPADLTTVAADQAAIQADLKNLNPGGGHGTGTGWEPGTGTTGTGGTTTGGTTPVGTSTGGGTSKGGTTGTGTTGTGAGQKKHGQKHKPAHAQHIKAAKVVHPGNLNRVKKH
jgi:hypothetical protein